jgi:acetyl-CoA acyltransferase
VAFDFTRPDDLAAAVIKKIMADIPNLEAERIDDVIVGNAMPEAEQGLNMGRLISLMGLDTVKVPGSNRKQILRKRPGNHSHCSCKDSCGFGGCGVGRRC